MLSAATHAAIEAQRDMQVQQVFLDLRGLLGDKIEPKTWAELLELLSLQKRRWVLCLDEFPYLTAADSSLPSRLQAWIDHSLPAGCLVILTGSSTRMMHDLFLHRAAPLYGRAQKLLHVEPMDYAAFCEACRQDPERTESFEKSRVSAGFPSTGSSWRPDRMSCSSWSRSTSTSRRTWSKSRSGSCATRPSAD